jgi:hypothetical protein
MKTKLTLTVDRHTVQKAKKHVGKTSESLSSVIENFLKRLTGKKSTHNIVDASRGLLKGNFARLSNKEIYKEHYKEKHGV